MTQQEILDYNEKCAEFLGAIYSKHADAWGFGNAVNIGSKKFDGIMYVDVIQAQRFEKDLKFDSDWNWIMELVEAIENKGYDVFINGLYCRITDSGMTDLEIESGKVTSKKESVVQAIRQFLIWYNENNS